MAKAILEFDLNEPDDVRAHLRAVKSTDMASFIFQLTSNTKKELEYYLEAVDIKGEPEFKDYEVLNLVFEKINELIDDYGINIDDLIR